MTSLERITQSLNRLQQDHPHVDTHFLEESRRWWGDKHALFPDSYGVAVFDTDAKAAATRRHPIVASFTAEEFVKWYARFFKERITQSGMLTDQRLASSISLVESELRQVAPRDPTIYPLVEQSLSERTRTTYFDGGRLSFIDALLPDGKSIRVVAKKVPDQLASLFRQEVTVHQSLAQVGYREKVTLPIHVSERNRVITYGHFAGDLRSLQEATEPIKKKYVQEALDMLLEMSVDLAARYKNEDRRNSFGVLAKFIDQKDHTVEYLVSRFCDNFVLRLAAAQDNVNPIDISLFAFQQVLRGQKKITEVPYSKDYPHLRLMVQNPAAQKLVQEYERGMAPAIAQLPRYPGHDDFTIYNVLAQEMETAGDKIFIKGLRLHDIGLVNAPFQSYIFDMMVSARASPSTQQEIMTQTHFKLKEECRRRNVLVQDSFAQFQEGYQVVEADKYLKQAALQFMHRELGRRE